MTCMMSYFKTSSSFMWLLILSGRAATTKMTRRTMKPKIMNVRW